MYADNNVSKWARLSGSVVNVLVFAHTQSPFQTILLPWPPGHVSVYSLPGSSRLENCDLGDCSSRSRPNLVLLSRRHSRNHPVWPENLYALWV